jgi:hypothetical protein
MTMELKEADLAIGKRRVGWLMKINWAGWSAPARTKLQLTVLTVWVSQLIGWTVILLLLRQTRSGQVDITCA